MDADDAFVSNISRRTDVDTNGYLDVIAHGTPNGIQITHNGQHMTVDHRTASRLIQNSDGYNVNITVRRSRQSGVARATCPD